MLAENYADKERINVEALQRSFKPEQIAAMENAINLMAENLLKDKKIQESDNDAVIIEKMLSGLIATRNNYLDSYQKALERLKLSPRNSVLKKKVDGLYDRLVAYQKMLDYERWLITHGQGDIRQGNSITDGPDAGGGVGNLADRPAVDGRRSPGNVKELGEDLIYKVPGSHDKNHYHPIIQKIRSEYAEELLQQQNNRQAKSRSKESGFFDAMKSLMQVKRQAS